MCKLICKKNQDQDFKFQAQDSIHEVEILYILTLEIHYIYMVYPRA